MLERMSKGESLKEPISELEAMEAEDLRDVQAGAHPFPITVTTTRIK